jgi:hypothetical protein
MSPGVRGRAGLSRIQPSAGSRTELARLACVDDELRPRPFMAMSHFSVPAVCAGSRTSCVVSSGCEIPMTCEAPGISAVPWRRGRSFGR